MPKRLKRYKDKEKARKTRNRQRARNYAQTALYKPRRWTRTEDILVLAHAIPDRELSKKICRGVRAIQIRRCKLKKERGENGSSANIT